MTKETFLSVRMLSSGFYQAGGGVHPMNLFDEAVGKSRDQAALKID
ncbi:MAG: hypothetical protein LC803_21470 [Acidobacteria bacterium]|nr:hypothetical protein [Acidobacteriota bacterium]